MPRGSRARPCGNVSGLQCLGSKAHPACTVGERVCVQPAGEEPIDPCCKDLAAALSFETGRHFFVEDGEEFVPRLVAELTVPIRSVSVARPTLDDVFMSYTGKTIRDAEAENPLRQIVKAFRARR